MSVILNNIKKNLKMEVKSFMWKRQNKHNFTVVGERFPKEISIVKVGRYSYGPLNVHSFGNSNEKLIIGDFCSIASGVKFLLGGEHSYKNISTYPFKEFFSKENVNTYTKGPIIIEDDVWIGEDTLILSGITVGRGSIIGAKSIVTKNIPPYAIYAGNKVIKYRFEDEIIKKLLKLDYQKLDMKNFKFIEEKLYENIDAHNIEEIINSISKINRDHE